MNELTTKQKLQLLDLLILYQIDKQTESDVYKVDMTQILINIIGNELKVEN